MLTVVLNSQPQNKTANSRQKDHTLLSWEALTKLDYLHIVLYKYKKYGLSKKRIKLKGQIVHGFGYFVECWGERFKFPHILLVYEQFKFPLQVLV